MQRAAHPRRDGRMIAADLNEDERRFSAELAGKAVGYEEGVERMPGKRVCL